MAVALWAGAPLRRALAATAGGPARRAAAAVAAAATGAPPRHARSAVNTPPGEPAPSFQHLPLGVPPLTTDAAAVAAKWSSDAMERVAAAPVTVVPGRVATCDGGGGALGHPLEFIKLDAPYPAVCKYCGAKFISAEAAGGY